MYLLAFELIFESISSFLSFQIPDGTIHFHVCGSGGKDCTGAKNVSACLKISGKTAMGLSVKKITYDGEAVRISYDDQAVLILYCGKNSDTPQYIGRVRN